MGKKKKQKKSDEESIEEILIEASAYNLRNEVVEMVKKLKQVLEDFDVSDDFSELELYQEAFNTIINPPEYLTFNKNLN